MFNSYIDALKNMLEDKESRFVALQLLELHKEVRKRKNYNT